MLHAKTQRGHESVHAKGATYHVKVYMVACYITCNSTTYAWSVHAKVQPPLLKSMQRVHGSMLHYMQLNSLCLKCACKIVTPRVIKHVTCAWYPGKCATYHVNVCMLACNITWKPTTYAWSVHAENNSPCQKKHATCAWYPERFLHATQQLTYEGLHSKITINHNLDNTK